MKKILFFGILFLRLNLSFAQTSNQNIEHDFMSYCKLVSEHKYDEALEYTNPRLFDIYPRERLKTEMESMFKMPDVEYKESAPIIKKISDIKTIENLDYAKINSLVSIEMKLKEVDSSNKQTLQMIQKSFETVYGQGNVAYDQQTGFFKINAYEEIIATSFDNQKNWKFITFDHNPKMKTLLEKIIPSEILK